MGRTGLYRVQEFYENLDVPVLFGLDASASDWGDSTLARTPDKIFEAGPKRVSSGAAMQAVIHEDVKIDVMHSETTSWSLSSSSALFFKATSALITVASVESRLMDRSRRVFGI